LELYGTKTSIKTIIFEVLTFGGVQLKIYSVFNASKKEILA
jgi:hypothetical protein